MFCKTLTSNNWCFDFNPSSVDSIGTGNSLVKAMYNFNQQDSSDYLGSLISWWKMDKWVPKKEIVSNEGSDMQFPFHLWQMVGNEATAELYFQFKNGFMVADFEIWR